MHKYAYFLFVFKNEAQCATDSARFVATPM